MVVHFSPTYPILIMSITFCPPPIHHHVHHIPCFNPFLTDYTAILWAWHSPTHLMDSYCTNRGGNIKWPDKLLMQKGLGTGPASKAFHTSIHPISKETHPIIDSKTLRWHNLRKVPLPKTISFPSQMARQVRRPQFRKESLVGGQKDCHVKVWGLFQVSGTNSSPVLECCE